jgi:hypothetical protein
LRHLEQVIDQQRKRASFPLGGSQVALDRFGIFHNPICQGFDHRADRSQGGLQVMPRPGDQVSAQSLQLALLLSRGLKLGSHLVERPRQEGDLVSPADRKPYVQVPGGDRSRRPVQQPDAVGQGAGQEISQRHGHPAGEQQEHRRQEKVVLAGEHQARRHPNVEEGEHAGQRVAAQQRPTQGWRTLDPAQPVGAIPSDRGDDRCYGQEPSHQPNLAHRRVHQQGEQG